ncbi:MAG TPA: UDP-N-acetylmuramoyl-tripeptide--D-alanyl-D-alanine ligase, partial [Thermoanaerobaculia bacterium]|nr:UDP-N-acetylmuramoyl-tripeptide--D-alanyl-D-alanine ligase [Thermoanaerobaculia bacterium]
MRLRFERIAEMTGGRVLAGGDLVAESFVIDSRETKEGSAFFALRGERLDGHDYLPQALETAAGAIVSSAPEPIPAGRALVRVPDTTRALQDLGSAVRRELGVMLIGITGSTGKTTTKEMIAALVETEKRTWKSWGNFNNHIGFPLCLANTPDRTEVVVSEMGMSAKGEIAFLARLGSPDIGVYTNIRPVHLEFFDSLDGIAAAKRELLENLRPGGSIVINADDPRVVGISEGFAGRRVTYGVEAEADYRGRDLRPRGLLGTEFVLEAEGASRSLVLRLPGRHNVENLLAAIATARQLEIGWASIEKAVDTLQAAAHRGVVVNVHGVTVYDDSYNSNPYALGRALELLAGAETEGRKIVVIGDMLELGSDELAFHHDAGKGIPPVVDSVIAVGPRSKSVLEGARAAGF